MRLIVLSISMTVVLASLAFANPAEFTAEQRSAHWKVLHLLPEIVCTYSLLEGRMPDSLKEMQDEGYLFFTPFNYLTNTPMSLTNGTDIGTFRIVRENGATFFAYDMPSGEPGKDVRIKSYKFDPSPEIGAYQSIFNANPQLKFYYRNPTHRKLLMMMECIGLAGMNHGPFQESKLMFSWNAWPLSSSAKNPVTGESLKMGKGPGQYNLWDETVNGRQFICFAVYDENGIPILNPFMKKVDKKTGAEWYDEWIGYLSVQPGETPDYLKQKLEAIRQEMAGNQAAG